MKKLFALILALSMLLTMAVASGEGEKTTVVFWNSWTGGDGDALQALVTKFNESQNEVFVDMTRTTSFGDMLQTSLPTKEAADLILLNCNDLNKYGSYLLPLNDIWENTSLKAEDFSGAYLGMAKKDDNLYGIPFQVTTYMMYYNKDLLAAAGIDAVPTTFAGWTEAAEKITALSTGYSSIFRLILCLSVNTPYLIFDEPVLGLDAQHRDLFYRLLVEKFAQGDSTILLSTHLISEVENLIDHTIILREGRVLRDAPTEELMANAYTVSGPAGLVDDYAAGRQVLTAHALGGLKTVSIQGRPEGSLPVGLEQSPLRLQDYFISLQEAEDQERKEESYGYEH